jgi:hypothetical protein
MSASSSSSSSAAAAAVVQSTLLNQDSLESMTDKYLLELTLYLSSLVYADHYYEKTLQLLLVQLESMKLITTKMRENLAQVLLLQHVEIRVDSSTRIVNSFQSLDVSISFFYKSNLFQWKPLLGRKDKPSGVIFRFKDDIIIAFRGTTKFNLKSSINNLNVLPGQLDSNSHALYGHRGFVRKLHKSRQGLEQALSHVIRYAHLRCTVYLVVCCC